MNFPHTTSGAIAVPPGEAPSADPQDTVPKKAVPQQAAAPASQPAPIGPKTVFLQTFGCQMNEYDSVQMLEQLRAAGWRRVERPEQAGLLLVNTCAIREKAEHKVYSLLGELAQIKAARPGTVIGVGGCVAQQRGAEMLRRAPRVDLVFGTDQWSELPAMLDEVAQGRRVLRTEWQPRQRQSQASRVQNFVPDFAVGAGGSAGMDEPQALSLPPASNLAQPAIGPLAQIAITKGCDNFCTFCIVPYTRGREVSREPDNIVAEARRLVARGAREITLLGQNVNSYRACGVDFVGLLERLDGLPGLMRLRYTSPHPKDFSERLAQAHRDLPRLCEHLHLPFQSGSDRILKAMRRNHRIGAYLEQVALARSLVPHLAISSDVIVGFPGESEDDFQGTLQVLRQVRFDQVYAFKYSPREGTPAASLPGQVPEDVKAERLERLFRLHEQIVLAINEALVGSRQERLVEGPGRQPGTRLGRTRGNKTATVLDCTAEPGTCLRVDIIAARRFALVAREAGTGERLAPAAVAGGAGA